MTTDNPHLTSNFGIGILRGLQRRPIYEGTAPFDPKKRARRLAQKASRRANRR